jgi:hypothetical protein
MGRRQLEINEEAGLMIDLEPIKPHQPDQKHRRDRRQKGYIAFLTIPVALVSALIMPFMIGSWLGVLGVILGLVWSLLMIPYAIAMFGIGKFVFYDTRPIPPDPINIPRPIKIIKNEEWRKPTPVRYLEEIKTSIVEIEEQAIPKYKRMQNAFANVVFPSSYSEYDTAMTLVKDYKEFSKKYEQLKESANRVYGGEVNAEINELQARIRRLQRERQELDGNYAESQSKVQETRGTRIANALAGARSEQIKRNIKDIDSEIIALESSISELKQIDQNLIQVKPKPTAAGQRENIAKLKREKTEKRDAMRAGGESEEAVRRWENMMDDAIAEAEEKLRELL